MKEQEKSTYKDAGVDIDAGNRFVEMIKPMVKATNRQGVLTDIGGFGGLFSLGLDKYRKPTLVSATDGVGTKLKIAFMTDVHETVGIDLVAMCVNDIVVQGAEPLFFLDYLATGKLSPEKAAEIVKGISAGCVQAGCALIGGETAEMPGMYMDGEYDVAGFSVGIVDSDDIVDGSAIHVGDRIIGLASSGLHSNGFSLARKVLFTKMELDVGSKIADLEKSLGEELLTPTRIYVKTVLNLMRDFTVKGIAHITGGGLLENLPRVLPRHCQARLVKDSWERPAIFDVLQKGGNIDEMEMYRTFNNGIGMAIIVPEQQVDDVLTRLSGLDERAWVIGEVARSREEDQQVIFE
ncbi:MAG: phosphoribosylformylglycinamidine cyclo-ligase [Desulfuromonadales bacterium]|nr:phosphoribosylformylglycinamidine cyclo-ligase [Desulfuromonadales bacterium]NIR34186.1 phosphoribosylformylglycinamidine cyclo-ligase [Desulfuromonadales bacterium]NIS41633.1 phosphoribosylformylglycinamidine cyclo-ligase [Desulfuromonadales bacterium]